MEEVFPKFIVIDNILILSKVTRHRQLIHEQLDRTKIKGGGTFVFNYKLKLFTLSGDSAEFGRASLEDIKNCFKWGNVYSDKYLVNNIYGLYNFRYREHLREGDLITILKEITV